MADTQEEVLAAEPVDVADDRPVHWSDGSASAMAMGEVDEQPSLAHFTKCGLQMGLDELRVTDNPDDLTCPDCA